MTVATRNGARALVDALEERGVNYLFGVPGHGAYPIYGALNSVPGIQPIIGRNEQGAAFIADGWAWTTNRVAICTSVPAAGLTNSATGLLEATLHEERMLFLLEHEPGHRDVLRSVVRYYGRADRGEDVQPAFHRLMDQLETERPAAAALEVPTEVLNAPVERAGRRPTRPSPELPEPRMLDEAANLLSRAERVAIVAGRPVVSAGAEGDLLRLAERLQRTIRSRSAAPGAPRHLGRSFSHRPMSSSRLARGQAPRPECETRNCWLGNWFTWTGTPPSRARTSRLE